MKETLQSGMTFTHQYQVPIEKTVPYVSQESDLFQTMPSVLATAFMVGLMEWACMEALRPFMGEDEISLGTNVCVTHSAATPAGMRVEIDVTLVEVHGSRTKMVCCRERRERDYRRRNTRKIFHKRGEIQKNRQAKSRQQLIDITEV